MHRSCLGSRLRHSDLLDADCSLLRSLPGVDKGVGETAARWGQSVAEDEVTADHRDVEANKQVHSEENVVVQRLIGELGDP